MKIPIFKIYLGRANNKVGDKNYHKKRKNRLNSFSRYNYILLLYTTIPLIIVGFFNWFIDPQDIFKSSDITTINHAKIKKDNNDRLFKAVDIIRLQPENIIMGSSRTKQGIDPDFLAIQGEANYYNLAINGPNFYEIKRYIEHAIYNQPNLKTIILGVDFFMFNQNLDNQPTFTNSRLEKKHLIIEDIVKNLFSLDAANNSIETIKASQSSTDAIDNNYGADGFMPRKLQNEKIIPLFHKSIALYYELHSDYQFSKAYWNDFQDIVELCRQNNIDLKVFISPAHATRWESIYTTKKWDVLEQWKRELAKLVPVWDFSGYNSITTEPISNEMKNYIDDSHYTPQIGNLIIERILGKESEIPADFGTLIDSKNIEQHLKKIRSDRQKWLKNNPEEVEMVGNFYTKVNQKKNE